MEYILPQKRIVLNINIDQDPAIPNFMENPLFLQMDFINYLEKVKIADIEDVSAGAVVSDET